MSKTAKLPVNVGGDPEQHGKGGVLGEATLTFTSGGVYIDVTLVGADADFPTLGFDRVEVSKALLAQNLADAFGGEVTEDGGIRIREEAASGTSDDGPEGA